jgi:hypothetical protein
MKQYVTTKIDMYVTQEYFAGFSDKVIEPHWMATREQQVEKAGPGNVYFRGSGGGFWVKVTEQDEQFVYMQRQQPYGIQKYRMPREDYERLTQ